MILILIFASEWQTTPKICYIYGLAAWSPLPPPCAREADLIQFAHLLQAAADNVPWRSLNTDP